MVQAAWLVAGVVLGLVAWLFAGRIGESRRTDIAYRVAEVAVVLLAITLSVFPVQSDDIFMHLAVGRRFFAEGHWPDPDPWLFTLRNYHRGWTDVWGSHLLAYLTYRAGGFPALVLAKAGLVAVAAIAPLWLARRLQVRTMILPAFTMLAFWSGSGRFIERTSIFSDVASAWVLALCLAELAQPSRRRRWILPFLFLLWTNLHPGILIGIGIVGAAALARPREWRRYLPLLAACIIASCIHPNGPRVLVWATQGILGGGFDVFRRYILEFLPTLHRLFRDSTPIKLFLLLAGAATALLLVDMRRKKSERVFRLVCQAAFLYLGFSTLRFVTTAALALPILIAPVRRPALPERRALVGTLLAAAVGLVLSARVAIWGYESSLWPPRHIGLGADPSQAPVRAANFVHRLPLVGNIFNQWSKGGFLAWLWDGNPRIYTHGYVLDQRFFREEWIAATWSTRDFDRVVAKYDLDLAFFDRFAIESSRSLRGSLTHRPEWRLVYLDEIAAVFLRVREEYREILDKYEYRYVNHFEDDRLPIGLVENRARVRSEATRLSKDAGRGSVLGRWARRILRVHFGQNRALPGSARWRFRRSDHR